MVERDRGMNSNIIIHYFKLRSKQLFRILKELGIIRSLFLSGLLFFQPIRLVVYPFIPNSTCRCATWQHPHWKNRFDCLGNHSDNGIYIHSPTARTHPFPELSNVAEKKLIPTKKYLNPKQIPNFTFSGVKLGVCFVKY